MSGESAANRTDFTTGSIPRHLLAFSVPMLIGNLLQAAYNTVDTMWVGKFLGAEALAAVSVSSPITFALLAFITGMTMATTTVIAQYFGAKRPDKVKQAISNSITVNVIMGLAFSLIGLAFRYPLLRLVSTHDDVITLASQYMGIVAIGLIPTCIYNVASSILRGLGDSKNPVLFLAYTTVINLILDPVLIFGIGPFPKMGVAGAAWATVFAQTVSAVLAMWYIARKLGIGKRIGDLINFDVYLTKLTFKIGIPLGAQQMLVGLGSMVLMNLVNQFGSIQAAGFGIGNRIDQFILLPSMSISNAVMALVGQNIGAGKRERIREIMKWAIVITVAITSAFSFACVFLPNLLASMFSNDAAVISSAALYLRVIGLAYIPFSVMFVFSGIFRGAGDALASFLMTLVSTWVVRLPLAYCLANVFKMGILGVWIGIAVGQSLGMFLGYGYYKLGKWKRKGIIKGRDDEPLEPVNEEAKLE